ncbi:MAG: bifunctional transaldolase/phosoglucose isomerase [Myxococcota bacterium]
MTNPLLEVHGFGQSIWYDDLSRDLVTSGRLRTMVERDGLRGVTSNPAIFKNALASAHDYDDDLRAALASGGDALALFERLAVRDIQLAADVLKPVHDATGGADGFVSLEVSPYLADDTEATVEEARRLRAAVGRPNVMIKVPATPEGLPAIERLIGEGIPVNVTLLFSVDTYAAVLDAYMAGLEAWVGEGGDPHGVASVASFFVSRIDAQVDSAIENALGRETDAERRARLEGLRGRIAVANARQAFALFRERLAGARWRALAERGASPQRLLWASTSTKNPSYPKTLYVHSLVGPDTVNTLPGATYEAFKESETPRCALGDRSATWEADLAEAREALASLESLGISLKATTDQLLTQGVQLFADAFDALLATIEERRRALLGADLASQQEALGGAEEAVARVRDDWRRSGAVRRLWARDAALWSGADESRWLAWLDAVPDGLARAEALASLVASLEPGRFDAVLLMGMGGSSLCPDVLARTFGRQRGAPQLWVLDSTVPDQVERIAAAIDPARTLFVVPSKSGSTIEPNVLMRAFHERAAQALGDDEAAAHARFVAITDPGSALESHARSSGFAGLAHGVPEIGGRFSALSNFGLLPAALMGLDPADLLARARPMVDACSANVPPDANPGVRLGIALAVLARQGRDKLTLVPSPGLASLGGWLEQLVAESTGKHGVGIVPVDGEAPGPPEVYGRDRVFVQIRLCSDREDHAEVLAGQDRALDALAGAGHPVVRIDVPCREQLAQEFFRWEIATAAAGAVLEINPFDQPDVEAAKLAARELMAAFERDGALPAADPSWRGDGLALRADPGLAVDPGASLGDALAAHLARGRPGDYFALNAFLDMNERNAEVLQRLRHRVRDRRHWATTLGFGPRFLHSTGQLHKGGPDSGLFLQLTCDAERDVAIPGHRYSFGVLARAQAQGDFQVLAERGRRIVWLNIEGDVEAGLARVDEAVAATLSS